MKKAYYLLALFLFIVLILFSQNFSYVGAQKCQVCHRTESQGQQYPIWEKSNHAKSHIALSSGQAQSAATALGISNPAESPQCLKCHAPLFEKAPELKAEGVSCEICHGPGSEYKKLSIMKNKEEAVKNGLIDYADTDAIKTQCLICHENAHGKVFDFAPAWEKIKHYKPK